MVGFFLMSQVGISKYVSKLSIYFTVLIMRMFVFLTVLVMRKFVFLLYLL